MTKGKSAGVLARKWGTYESRSVSKLLARINMYMSTTSAYTAMSKRAPASSKGERIYEVTRLNWRSYSVLSAFAIAR